jgi:Fe-S oxidoreductase
MMWRQIYPRWAEKFGFDFNIKTKHYTEVIAEQIKAGKFRFPDIGKKIKVNR